MNTIAYNPSADQLVATFGPLKGKATRKLGRFKLWWDDEGNIHRIAIGQFREQLEEFKKSLGAVRLGGIWRELRVTEKDIEEAREGLLEALEGRW